MHVVRRALAQAAVFQMPTLSVRRQRRGVQGLEPGRPLRLVVSAAGSKIFGSAQRAPPKGARVTRGYLWEPDRTSQPG